LLSIKLIATDLDGTYLHKGELLKTNAQTALQAKSLGIQVVACTARVYATVRHLLSQLHVGRYVITSNGAAIYDQETNKSIYTQYIEPRCVKPLIQAVVESGSKLEVYSEGLVRTCPELASSWANEIWNSDQPYAIVEMLPDINALIERVEDCTETLRIVVAPGLPMPQNVVDLVYALHMGDNLTCSYTDHWDINHELARKEIAIKHLAKTRGISMLEVMALGDSDNDIGMIREAGVGVAMANAPLCVREQADFITLPVDEAGWSSAVRKFAIERE